MTVARTPPRLAIIGSSGGSALAAAVECLRLAGSVPKVSVIVDRACGMATWAYAQGCDLIAITHHGVDDFSQRAAAAAKSSKADAVLLFYTRRVGAALYAQMPTYNIHPSLLPSFAGLQGLEESVAFGSRVVGATLHLVTGTLDGGPVVGQIATGIGMASPSPEKVSFLQKVYLTLVLHELLSASLLVAVPAHGKVTFAAPIAAALNASPSLSDPRIRACFDDLQTSEGCRVVEAYARPPQ